MGKSYYAEQNKHRDTNVNIIKLLLVHRVVFICNVTDGGVTYLFVGEYEQDSVAKLVLLEHTMQLVTCLSDTLAIIAVHDEDEALGILEVVAPQWSNLVLTADVPHGEADVLVLDSLDVKAYANFRK